MSDDSRTADLPAGRVSYSDTGSGAPLLFVHGFLTDRTLWRKLTPLLSSGYRCIAPDWPLGSGAASSRVPMMMILLTSI